MATEMSALKGLIEVGLDLWKIQTKCILSVFAKDLFTQGLNDGALLYVIHF